MSRLTNTEYFTAHHWLRRLWLDDIGSYAQISERNQADLHLFFCPSKDWADDQLLDHRQAIGKVDPSLPQRAGRALARFRQVVGAELQIAPAFAVFPAHGRHRGHVLSVRAVRAPEPDLKKLSRALLRIAIDQQKAERDQDKAA